MKSTIDKKDMDILTCLRKNSREKLKKIAREVKLPISTVYDRIKKMEESGAIARYSCLIEPRRLNHSIKAKILINVPNELKDTFEKTEKESLCLNSIHRITGGDWNYLAEGIFVDIDQMYGYIEGLTKKYPALQQKISYVIDELKHEGFLEEK